MVQEITTAIGRLPWLLSINSSFAHKGKSMRLQLRQVACLILRPLVFDGTHPPDGINHRPKRTHIV